MKKKLMMMSLLAMVCAAGVAQTEASAVYGKKQTLFSSVNHADTPYRIPTIAMLNNGSILVLSDQRPCGADVGNGEVDIYAKVGTIAADGSYSWNPSSTDPSVDGGLKIADGTDGTNGTVVNGYGDAAVVVDRESGKVLVICVSGNVVFGSGSSSDHNKMARIIGSADGLTWQSPEDVTTAFFDNLLPSAYTMFMTSGRMIQSQQVKVGDYYRIYGALLVRESGPNHNNYVVYSDDLGETWKVLGNAKACGGRYSSISLLAGNYADEAKVEELPNGDIVLSSRKSGGRYFNVYTYSDKDNWDGTKSGWGTAKACTFAGSNSTNGELMLYKGLVDANGTAYNVMLQSLPTGSSRSNVAVYYKAFATDKSSWAVSDFTSGWTKGIEVDNGASAYSTMTILPNGQIGFLYEDDYDTSKADGDYSNIVYVPLTASEITGGAYNVSDNEEEEPVVPVDPELSLSAAATPLTVGGTTQLTVSTNSDGAVTYTSSNTAVATVSASGVVTAVAAGTATITANVAATEQYNAASATATININKVNATLSLSAAATTLTEGETTQLTATTNSDATVTYTSSNTAVATVSANGVVTAVAAGTATITASVAATTKYTAASATATITVEAAPVVEPEEPVTPVDPEISLSAAATTLTEGETTQLTLTTNSDGAITYTSSNTAVATVSANGVVTAVAAGTATITANVAATEQYNAASATATITVEAAPVVEPEEPETPVIDEALQQAINDAKAIAAYSGVGYPSATAATRTALESVITNAEAGAATADELSAAVSAFKSETSDIQMPEEGKTYTFANVAMDGTKRYFSYASSGITAVTDAASATEFTCEVIDASTGEYAFVTDGGQYLIWKGPSGTEGFWFWKKTYGYNDNMGYVTSYNSTYCDLVVEKLTAGDNVSASSDAELFGLVAIKGWRYSRSEYGYFTLTGATFDASADPYYDSTYSSAFLIEDTGAAAKARTRDTEDTTSIENTEVPTTAQPTGIYDLMGRRVTEMQKGRIYIVNGVKTIYR